MSYIDSGFDNNLIRDDFPDAESTDDSSLIAEIATAGALPSSAVAAALVSSGVLDSNYNLIGDVISSAINTQTQQILGDFTFGASGALIIATDLNNGLWISPTGLLGKKGGVSKIAIEVDGDVTFAGELVAAVGTLGALNIASGGNIKFGKTAYSDDTHAGFWLGDDSGSGKLNIGVSSSKYLHYDGSDFSLVGGTIYGGLIRATGSSSGVDVRMSSGGLVEFLHNDSQKGYIGSNTDGVILIQGDDDIFITSDSDVALVAHNSISFFYNDNGGSDSVLWSSDGDLMMYLDDGGDLVLANGSFVGRHKSSNGTAGVSITSYDFVTLVAYDSDHGNYRKTRSLTFKDGILTNVGAESGKISW